MIRLHQSYIYAQKVINKESPAPKYVIKQCEEFLKICDEKTDKYFLSEIKLKQINDILSCAAILAREEERMMKRPY